MSITLTISDEQKYEIIIKDLNYSLNTIKDDISKCERTGISTNVYSLSYKKELRKLNKMKRSFEKVLQYYGEYNV